MSYSERFCYAQHQEELDALGAMFAIQDGGEHDAWMRHASLPHFGLDMMLDEATDEEIRQHFKRVPPEDVENYVRSRKNL